MPSVRDDINQVKKSVNAINPDVRLPNQFVYDKLMDVTKLILRREAEIRKIYSTTEVFKTLHCVELTTSDTLSCTGLVIPKCEFVSKSINKIPKAFLTPGNGSIMNVMSIDRSFKFIPTTSSIYMNILKREFKGNGRYYWIENDYLYIPGRIAEVMITGIFLDNSLVDSFNDKTKKCYNFMSSESVIPDWLRKDIFDNTVQVIANITKRIPEDENTNSNSNILN